MKETPDTYGDHFLSEHPIHENSRNVYSFLRTIKNIEIKHGIKPYEYDNEPSYPDDGDECNIDQAILSRLDGIYGKLVDEFIDDGYEISYEPYYFRTVESIRVFKQVDITQLSIDDNE